MRLYKLQTVMPGGQIYFTVYNTPSCAWSVRQDDGCRHPDDAPEVKRGRHLLQLGTDGVLHQKTIGDWRAYDQKGREVIYDMVERKIEKVIE